jgi:hypothetical protein
VEFTGECVEVLCFDYVFILMICGFKSLEYLTIGFVQLRLSGSVAFAVTGRKTK